MISLRLLRAALLMHLHRTIIVLAFYFQLSTHFMGIVASEKCRANIKTSGTIDDLGNHIYIHSIARSV